VTDLFRDEDILLSEPSWNMLTCSRPMFLPHTRLYALDSDASEQPITDRMHDSQCTGFYLRYGVGKNSFIALDVDRFNALYGNASSEHVLTSSQVVPKGDVNSILGHDDTNEKKNLDNGSVFYLPQCLIDEL
jgi:hypothetical protein